MLKITDDAVAINSIEVAIAERAFAQGWVRPRPAACRSGRWVAVIGSGAGPAPHYHPVPGTETILPAELVLIAIGFSGP